MAHITRTCSIEGCGRAHNAHGWCLMHYKRWQKYGDPLGFRILADPECSVQDCAGAVVARSWCSLHYQRWQKWGDPGRERARGPQQCTVSQCDKFRVSDGLCSKHYMRLKRHGSPTARLAGEVINGRMVCCNCGVDKLVDEYPEGRAGRCKPCRALYHAAAEQRAKRAEWAAANADVVREYGRRHAALRRARGAATLTVEFTAKQLADRMAFFGNRCWMCRGGFDHIDHVKPIARGGAHILANLRPACARCNQSKSAKWAGVRGLEALIL